MFDSGIGLSALQRSTTLNQNSLNAGLGSIGLGINALNNGQMSSNAVTVTSSLPITSLSSATIDTRDQIISDSREQLVSSVQAMHASLLAEQSQNNSTNLQNPPLFSMVIIFMHIALTLFCVYYSLNEIHKIIINPIHWWKYLTHVCFDNLDTEIFCFCFNYLKETPPASNMFSKKFFLA